MLVPVRQREGVNTTEKQQIWGPTLFPGSCLTSTSPHPAPGMACLNSATLGKKMGAVVYVHDPLESTQWETMRAQGKPLEVMGGIRAGLNKALPLALHPRKKEAKVSLSQKSRTQKYLNWVLVSGREDFNLCLSCSLLTFVIELLHCYRTPHSVRTPSFPLLDNSPCGVAPSALPQSSVK